ncbi:MAG: YkvA family protein [Candidatus Nanopelagicales bacterium]
MSKSDLVLIALAVLYVLSPVDLIPEIVTGPLGLTDDMAAFALIAATVMRSRGRQDPVAVPVTYRTDA